MPITAKAMAKKPADRVAKRNRLTVFPLWINLFPSVKFWQ